MKDFPVGLNIRKAPGQEQKSSSERQHKNNAPIPTGKVVQEKKKRSKQNYDAAFEYRS